ncbi:protein of unknown function DUF4205 [Trinorchestia longiramus]|nr:protein of unknown function DUF4205 [Trinorchestia longiramus]
MNIDCERGNAACIIDAELSPDASQNGLPATNDAPMLLVTCCLRLVFLVRLIIKKNLEPFEDRRGDAQQSGFLPKMPKLLWRNKGLREDDTRTIEDSKSPSPRQRQFSTATSADTNQPPINNGRTVSRSSHDATWHNKLSAIAAPLAPPHPPAYLDFSSNVPRQTLSPSSHDEFPASIGHRRNDCFERFSSLAALESNSYPSRNEHLQLSRPPPQHRHSLHFFSSSSIDQQEQNVASLGLLQRSPNVTSATIPFYTRRSSISTPSLLSDSLGANLVTGELGFESFKVPHDILNTNNTGTVLIRRESFRSSPVLGAIPYQIQNQGHIRIYGASALENQDRINTNDYAQKVHGVGKFRGNIQQKGDIFGAEETAEDISKMAAQRDQQRGTGRHIRGMMGPVQAKEDEKSFARKPFSGRNRVESLEGHDLDHSLFIPGNAQDSPFQNFDESGDDRVAIGIVRGKSITNKKSNSNNECSKKSVYETNRGDIMTQSLRRQTKRTLKPGQPDPVGTSTNGDSVVITHEETPDKFIVFKSSDTGFTFSELSDSNRNNRRSKKSFPDKLPSSREDVQVLNLQGFMDSSIGSASASLTVSSPNGADSKKKSKRRRSKKSEDSSGDYSLRIPGSRRKRYSRSRNRGQDDNEEEVALRDLDELDDEMSGLVIGPRLTSSEPAGVPITLEIASDLRKILTGNPASPLPLEWMTQNFQCNLKPNLSYGLVQKKGGPCGVLACIQAHMMKCLMFGSLASPHTSPASPLRPSSSEWGWALTVALTEIIWRAGSGQHAVIALPNMFPQFTDHGIGRYSMDGVTETLTFHTYTSQAQLLQSLEKHLAVFTRQDSPACVLLLYSVMLTRGLEAMLEDMDSVGVNLINNHGYASQEVVNLMLTGHASTNTFDGDTTLGDDVPSRKISINTEDAINQVLTRMTLRGVHQRADIGLLSLFEHYGSYKVGQHLKTPVYPVWVVCSESHYSCLFSRNPSVTSNEPQDQTFDLYYYDGLALQEDEIRLTIRLGSDEDLDNSTLVPPLELCIRTKWATASVDWHNTEPLL